MGEEDANNANLHDAQAAAIVASVTIVVFFVVYWGIQIQDVIDMLKLAYG